MKATFTLFTRINQKFVPILIKKGQPVLPAAAGSFYVRYSENGKRIMRPLGKDFDQACLEVKNLEIGREFDRRGIALPASIAPKIVPITPSLNLAGKMSDYLEEIESNKAPQTYNSYRIALGHFGNSCKRVDMASITREDLLAFKVHLRKQELSDRTVFNNFLFVMIFLKWCGLKVGIKKGDWPDKVEREPEEYTDEQIEALLTAANPQERLVLNCFLCSGLRSGELGNLTYGDIDFKHSVWTVQRKESWKTKTRESQRDVPVPAWVTEKLRERMVAGSRTKSDLIFFDYRGNVNQNLLRIVKRVAKVAKLTGRIDDHKFRSTAITRWLRDGNTVPDVMKWVGHVNPQTILRYAAKVNVRNPETLKKASGAFAKFAGMGD